MRVSLIPHPQTPSTALTGIDVQVVRHAGGGLELHYFAQGGVEAVKWPPPCASARADGLWETTCFEAFVQPQGRASYIEFNFAPSTLWAAYRFTGERAGMQLAHGLSAPVFRTRETARTHVLHVRLGLDAMPGLPVEAEWRLGLSAVIEALDGSKSYWALRHPAPKPDFHNPQGFALKLAAPEAA